MSTKALHIFKSPWLGTLILTLLGAMFNYWKLELSFTLVFVFGNAAILIILRLYGLSFALPAMLIANIPLALVDTFALATFFYTLELLFLSFCLKRFRQSSLLKLDSLFWIVIGLPLMYKVYTTMQTIDIDPRLVWLLIISRLLNFITNALIASIAVESLLSRVPVGNQPVYPTSIHRIIFKYLLTLVMATSILILFVNSNRQFNDMLDWGSNYLERSSRIYTEQLGKMDHLEQKYLMQRFKADFGVDSIILSANHEVTGTTIKQADIQRFIDETGYVSVMRLENGNTFVYEQYPAKNMYRLERWQETYFLLKTKLADGSQLLITLPYSYYLYPMYDYYLQAAIRLLIIIGISIVLARLISRKIARPLEQLIRSSSNIPTRLKGERKLDWPQSNMIEMRRLIRNFKQMVEALEYQFLQIQKDKEQLEIRVIERTLDLAESEAQKNAILEMAVDAIISTDSRLRITAMNPAAERMFQCKLQDVEALPLSTILRLEEHSDERQSSRVLALRPDGSTFAAELTRSSVRNEGASVHTFFIHDLTVKEHAWTGRNEHERQLLQLTERLLAEQGAADKQKHTISSPLQSADKGIVVCDSNQIITFINPTMLLLFGIKDYTGYSIQELLAAIQTSILPMQNMDSMYSWLQARLNKQATEEDSLPVVLHDGRTLLIYVAAVNDPDHHKKHGFMLIFRDSTSEQKIKQLQNELITVVSHELRTPLSSMMGYIEILIMYEDIPLEKRREFLTTIQHEGSRLSRLLNDFLDSQRIESGYAEYSISCISMRELLPMICCQWDIQSRDRLRVSVPNKELYVLGDHNRLIQVISNLISNALKYSPESKPVDVRLKQDQDYVVIEIEDYGLGIPEQDQPQIFQKFFRSSSAESRKIRGTGLGLYIAQRIVHDHQGKLQFTSEPGAGSVFMIILPQLDPSAEN